MLELEVSSSADFSVPSLRLESDNLISKCHHVTEPTANAYFRFHQVASTATKVVGSATTCIRFEAWVTAFDLALHVP